MTFAEKLKDLRQKAGLTQEGLAGRSGVPLWSLRNYEQGRREPNWKAALQLAKGLGVPVEEFADCMAVAGARSPSPKRPRRPRKGKR